MHTGKLPYLPLVCAGAAGFLYLNLGQQIRNGNASAALNMSILFPARLWYKDLEMCIQKLFEERNIGKALWLVQAFANRDLRADEINLCYDEISYKSYWEDAGKREHVFLMECTINGEYSCIDTNAVTILAYRALERSQKDPFALDEERRKYAWQVATFLCECLGQDAFLDEAKLIIARHQASLKEEMAVFMGMVIRCSDILPTETQAFETVGYIQSQFAEFDEKHLRGRTDTVDIMKNSHVHIQRSYQRFLVLNVPNARFVLKDANEESANTPDLTSDQ